MFKKNLLIIPLIIVSYFTYQFIFVGSDQKQIKNLFKEIKQIVSIDGTLKKNQILSRTLRLKKLIKKDVILKAFEGEDILFEKKGFENIQGAAFMGAKLLSEHSVIIQDIGIDVETDIATANIVTVSSGKSIESDGFRELFTSIIQLKKTDNKWQITSAVSERMTSDYE